jgi:hypothetical protein
MAKHLASQRSFTLLCPRPSRLSQRATLRRDFSSEYEFSRLANVLAAVEQFAFYFGKKQLPPLRVSSDVARALFRSKRNLGELDRYRDTNT